MDDFFKPMSREEFFESIDRGLAQAKSGQRLDAIEAVKEIDNELKAGYEAMNAIRTMQTGRQATNS